MRIALGLEYDGGPFHGWQTQPGGGTVQDAVEVALAAIAGEPVHVVCAGRTDAGVHARGQVLHFDTRAKRPGSAWVRGVNSRLPSQIAVQWSCTVGEGFHARFSATGRRYDYFLLNRPARSALEARGAGWYHAPLDHLAMRTAAACLVGEHDFSAFRSSECQAKSPVRNVDRIEISRVGDMVQFTFHANAFLHHMVRNIVGSLIEVGKGRCPPDWIGSVLESRSRALAAPTFAPQGLYLTSVDYDSQWRLPAFPAATRAGNPE